MRIAIAQTDARLGDVRSNLNEARQRIAEAAEDGADLVVFPELSLHGYALGSVAEDTSVAAGDPRLAALSEAGPDVLVGVYERAGLRHHNTSVYASGGRVVHVQRKLYLPNYLMWEERKHFYPGQRLNAFDTSHGRMASLICNDAWQPMLPWLAAQDGAEVLLVTANSAAVSDESTVDNFSYWRELLRYTARMQQCWVVFVNRVGEENGASFWGGSHVVDPGGAVVAEAPLWEPALVVADVDVHAARQRRRAVPLLQDPRFDLLSREIGRLHAAETG
ncbi:nitrilase-related carbon-nitrogen hydrolase [Nocardiopsis composta]|uniref:Putative amidohydrolase n=1 Tax=Nocardiopsis composta TaxID=157465 RepID=A0A7W8VCB6_9ACTN|nr:nitrilase-related carbon-nitrogen hydrolase [Nocardiopsis composta]MBB5430795.1 putative amidohydrolase [Nocardiopsis composta]